ncbi:MAG: nucleotidyltransferase family protein [Prevotella sp.]|nr:nucleotidyltransferase family protein [Prevotella sp.]
MRTSQEYIDLLKQHAAELNSQFGITSMRLFGSVARNEHREGSDIDLFVTMPPKFYNHILAAQYLEELLGCPVDLIQDHKNIRQFFKEQIERDGITVFSHQPFYRASL